MAIEDIISEEITTQDPNMEIAQGSPDDFMSEDEMDPYQDPEFQQLLDSMPSEQAQALMQLIKEYKEMVAKGFQGEFEDFVKIKMATAEGDDVNEFQSEDEMIIEPDEIMDIEKQIVPTEMVAKGGRIGNKRGGGPDWINTHKPRRRGNPPVFEKKNRRKREEGGIMGLMEDEEVMETGPNRQQMIIDYLTQRGLPITPENIQKAIIEMVTGGMPYTEEASYDMPQMDRSSVLPPGMMMDETITERTPSGIASLTEDVMTPPIKPMIYDAPVQQQPWDTQKSTMFAAEGGRAGFDNGGPVDDEEYNAYVAEKQAAGEEYMDYDTYKLFKINLGPFPMAAGGRVPYGLGSLVKKVFKGATKGVKSLVKSVKKFAKSDLGKAALMYMATAGLGNIGAAGGLGGKQAWMSGQWLKPTNVLSNLGSSYGNLSKYFSGAEASKASSALTSGNISPQLSNAVVGDASLAGKSKAILNWSGNASEPTGIMNKLATSFKTNPMPWILGSSLAGGAYTAANPGEQNLDRVMGDRNKEVAEWDNIMANIRSGQEVTPFTTGNVMFPYPNYYQNVAQGGRIGRAEGGIMDLDGMEKDYRETGGFVPIGEYEKKDDVPARLSLNEFVMTADAVRGAGNGDVDKGAEVMEDMMETLEQQGQRHRQAQDMFSVSERLSEVVN